MESWYKVGFVFSEAGVRAKAVKLQNEYSRIFVKHRGPKDALVFTDREHNDQHYDYYFSPGAMLIAESLVLSAGGVPCARPDRDRVTLAVGSIHSVNRVLPRQV
ncbi:MAG: hypothetical protein WAM65_14645 [Candidatus Korobacteraceae bacterium]